MSERVLGSAQFGPQPRPADPEYISAMEHFESVPHERIYAGTQQIDAGEIARASLVWLNGAATIGTAMPITRSTTDGVMNSAGWEGAAADAAYASTRSFAESLDDLAEVMAEVGARLGAVAAAAEAVKLAVVPPGASGPIGAVARALEAAHVIDAQLAQETLRQEAVLAMNMIYKPAYSGAGTGIPALPDPPALPGDTSPNASGTNHTAPQSLPPQQQHPATPQQPETSQTPTPPATPTPPTESTPSPTPPESTQPPSTAPTPAPQSPSPSAAPAPPASPAPAPPAPAPPASPAPAPPADPRLSDPGGQPGITGPIPHNTTPTTPDQPGISPDH
ncbi:hypothetical protein [Nocardia jiangxiensis]|uniref:hypothetical protein n=1 Tax=Nocardia jiangxiensis TaxID=282685 RepID=UPI0002F48E26|nr:hypothetical protein [Nocardia jiangxiensis]